MRTIDLQGHVALVTGSSLGLGAAIARMVAETPLGHAGSPRHVADAVLFFVSPPADFVTGANLQVAGGHNL